MQNIEGSYREVRRVIERLGDIGSLYMQEGNDSEAAVAVQSVEG